MNEISTAQAGAKAPTSTRSLALPVEGMTCAACATRLEKVLSSTPGVTSANVSFAASQAELRFDPEAVKPADLAERVRDAGFEVPPQQIDLTISGMTCASCIGRVEKALSRVPGVTEVAVNLATERATIKLVPGSAGPADLVAAVQDTGYGATIVSDLAEEVERDEERVRRAERKDFFKLVIAVALTLPLVGQMIFELGGLHLRIPGWVQMILAAPVQFWIGWRFYEGAYRSLKGGAGNMDVLVALGTTSAYGLSTWLVLTGRGDQHLYFEAAAVVITLVLLGKMMEGRAKRSAASAIRALMKLRPDTARVEKDGRIVELSADAVGLGDIVLVRPGERVPVDGVVVEGESAVDESLVTGESLPVQRGPGDDLPAGAVNGDGLLRVRATAVGADATIARMIRLVQGAQASKAPVQKMVDKISAVFVPIVVVIALVTFASWWLFVGLGEAAFLASIAVLVVACPCALGLATPTAIMVGTGISAKHGMLIKDAESLELAHRAQVVVFDKTGTLTEGKPAVAVVNAADPNGLLRLAASAQQGSEHPLAKAYLQEAEGRGLDLLPVSGFRSLAGRGLEATVDGKAVLIGSDRLARERDLPIADFRDAADAELALGRTVTWVAAEGQLLGFVSISDKVKPNARAAVQKLRELGVEPVMLTGDNRRAAEAVARELGIDRVLAEVLPEDKSAEIMRLRGEGKVVAMVGDGVNDAPALAAADVGIAMGTGADVAMQAAGLTLMRGDPILIPDALSVSRATYHKIRQNLFWAFIYNIVALPLAALGILSPMIAGAAMAMSSVSVVSNSLLLRRWKPGGRA